VPMAGARRRALTPADDAIRFTVVVFLASLTLQRFALPLGELPLSIVGPIGLLCGAFWLMRGALVLDRRRVLAMLVLTAAGLLGSALSLAISINRLPAISWTSLAQFLLLHCFAMLAFREEVEEGRFFRAVNACLAFVGVAGILQFLVQFAGLSVFTFSEFGVPVRFTVEKGYNLAIPAYIGASFFKANGFFLVEPSVYSQFMALGLAIELVFFRRPVHLAIFSLGLVLSVSGTGWLVLGAFVAGAAVHMGPRGIAMGLGTAVCGALGLGVLALTLPEVFAFLLNRASEFSSPGSSGHIRFVTPWWALGDAIDMAPWTLFVGLGPGTAERLPLTYLYGMSTPLKVVIEYGLPALAAYLALFLAADRTPRQRAVLPAALVLFLFTGTYVQFPPVLFPILLITTIVRLRPDASLQSSR
jgi:hypothetical protein